MKKIVFLLFGFLIFYKSDFAQNILGNEWIVPAQQYAKIKVAATGLYRISWQQLKQIGFSLTETDAENFQLFHHGTEQYLYIKGAENHRIDSGDYIEFFGEKNDGRLDSGLYEKANFQPGTFYSFYTDTSVYFLTYSDSGTGKRFNSMIPGTFNGTPESYFICRQSDFYTNSFNYGALLSVGGGESSEYTEGEGFTGEAFNLGQTLTKSLLSKGFVNNGVPAIAEFLLSGRSNASSSTSYNHHVRVGVSMYSGFDYIYPFDTLFSGYKNIRKRFIVDPAKIGPATYFRFQPMDDQNAASDYNSVAYIALDFPHDFDLNNGIPFPIKIVGYNTNDSSHITFKNYKGNSPICYDLTNHLRIPLNLIGTDLKVNIPGAGSSKIIFIADSLSVSEPSVEPVQFNFYDITQKEYDFIIISSKKLESSANNYLNYRNSKGYKCMLAFSEDLYNQFFYGQHHPLAIRHFADYLLQKGKVKPTWLLLLGKGIQTDLYRNPLYTSRDLVPGIGLPPSDNMFTSGLDGTLLEPAIATARIAAESNDDVQTYLDKLIAYENAPSELWRKNILHLSGGSTHSETTAWSGYMRSLETKSKGIYFGAHTINYLKDEDAPITNHLKEKIINNINEGTSLLSFFGHGATFATEINFGQPDELNNKDKYPVYLLNGCLVGNHEIDNSLGEIFLFAKDKGAIGWMASSGEGFPHELFDLSAAFYDNSFKSNYGASIAENIRLSIRQFQNTNDIINRAHCRQLNFQGDPALHFYAPEKPDYFVENKDVFMKGQNINSLSDSFAIGIIIHNAGKATKDSVYISIEEKFANNTTQVFSPKKFIPVYNHDTIYYWIDNHSHLSKGLVNFKITIDPSGKTDELNESNNTAILTYIFPSLSVSPLFPQNYAIHADSGLKLIAQSNNLMQKNIEYIFELDTIESFSSPFKKSSGFIASGFMVSWQPAIPLINQQVYYWRVRLNLPFGQGGDWEQSSFVHIDNSPQGYFIKDFGQFYNNLSLQNILTDTISHQYKFDRSAFGVDARTRGNNNNEDDDRNFYFYPGAHAGFIGTEYTGFTMIAMNPVTLDFYSPHSKYNFQNEPGDYSGQFLFNINVQEDLDSMLLFLQNIPNQYYVLGLTGKNINLKNLPAPVMSEFKTLGCIKTNTIPAGFPYIFFGQKGLQAGEAEEYTADTIHSSVPGSEQKIFVEKEYYSTWDRGKYTSTKTGPVKSWEKIYFRFDKQSSDSLNVNIHFTNGIKDSIISFQHSEGNDSLDISHIRAAEFPYIYFTAEVSDHENRTPPQLREYKIIYHPFAEGSLNPMYNYLFHNSEIQEGDSLYLKISYMNLSKEITDTLICNFAITQADRSQVIPAAIPIKPVKAGDTILIEKKIPTLNLKGNCLLFMDVEPKSQTDLYGFNNYMNIPFFVNQDKENPYMEVLFNGKKIFNNDLVSPQPTISITTKDENKFRLLNDTGIVNIYLRKPGRTTYEKISYTDKALQFIAAKNGNNNKSNIYYKPTEPLPDGIYGLRVNAHDASGNASGNKDFEVNFEVVNESSITHFYPYPNPFTTRMHFVFTLTGTEVPDYLKVQIINPAGKVVREILQNEFGPIQIGNNISSFVWDGTDQYGDRLANGVYFYQVFAKLHGKAIKSRETSADHLFQKNMGKIYLMR